MPTSIILHTEDQLRKETPLAKQKTIQRLHFLFLHTTLIPRHVNTVKLLMSKDLIKNKKNTQNETRLEQLHISITARNSQNITNVVKQYSAKE